MSLEAKIEELIAAVNANTEAQKSANAAYEKAVESYNAAPAGEGETKRGRGRPKKDEAEPKAETPAETPKDEPKAEAKPAKPAEKDEEVSDDTIRAVFGSFMRVDDEAERESRKSFVKKLLADVNVAKALDIPAEKRAAAVAKIEAEQAKRDAAGDDDLV